MAHTHRSYRLTCWGPPLTQKQHSRCMFPPPLRTIRFNILAHLVSVSSGCHNRYHRLGGLNNRPLLLPVLEAGNLIRFLVRVFFLACRWLTILCVLTWHREKGTSSLVFYLEGHLPHHGAPPHDLINPKHLPKAPSHWGIRA